MVELGVYKYIRDVDKQDKIKYIIVIIALVYVNTILVKSKISHFMGLMIGIMIIVIMNDKKLSQSDDINRSLEIKLKLLDQTMPQYFHLDSNMINLFFSIKDFKQYNEDAYRKALKLTDNVLHLKFDMEKDSIVNYVESFEIAYMMTQKALNYMQSFIITIPSNKVMHKKFQAVLERHHILLKRNLDYMFDRCKELTKDIDHTTKFITDYGFQQPYNPKMYDIGYTNFNIH